MTVMRAQPLTGEAHDALDAASTSRIAFWIKAIQNHRPSDCVRLSNLMMDSIWLRSICNYAALVKFTALLNMVI